MWRRGGAVLRYYFDGSLPPRPPSCDCQLCDWLNWFCFHLKVEGVRQDHVSSSTRVKLHAKPHAQPYSMARTSGVTSQWRWCSTLVCQPQCERSVISKNIVGRENLIVKLAVKRPPLAPYVLEGGGQAEWRKGQCTRSDRLSR